jgi:hypothetical protein
MATNLLVVFYKNSCGYCHKLVQEPFEKTAAECKANALFIDAADMDDCPLKYLFDPKQGVPQTNLLTVSLQNQVVGYLPQAQHSETLRGQ